MDFVSNREEQVKEMLASIGVASIEELFCQVPESIFVKKTALDDGLSEFEGLQLMESIGGRNTYPKFQNYLGAGAYEHHVPSIVGAVCSQSEFLTAYTPYQAEASQGMLQAIFEFQSSICALTGMDVSNASVYDAASACAEAVLMSLRHQRGCSKILLAETLHPHYRAVVELYVEGAAAEIEIIPADDQGRLDLSPKHLDDDIACLILQSPNFYGVMEDVAPISQKIKESGVLLVLCANPMSYGIYASAGELGADIAVGDAQPFGLPLQFGGPYAGYVACRKELVRQLPGRIVGETVDTEGRRGFVLTLQAREQHIRRDKATSNICTNQALAALACLVGMLWYGKDGAKEVALTNFQRASYLKAQLEEIPGVKTLPSPIFNEFVVNFGHPVEKVRRHFEASGIEPGLGLESMKDNFLVSVTETKNQEQLDQYVSVAKELR